MDRRLLLALVLTAIVVIGTNLLFPPARPHPATTTTPTDSSHRIITSPVATSGNDSIGLGPNTLMRDHAGPAVQRQSAVRRDGDAFREKQPETTTVTTPTARYVFTNAGAAPIGAILTGFRDRGGRGVNPVELVVTGDQLLQFQLIAGRDTIHLDTIRFELERSTPSVGIEMLRYSANAAGRYIDIDYMIRLDSSYLTHVHGIAGGTNSQPSFLLATIPERLRSEEADTLDDHEHLAFALKPQREGAKSIPFGKLDPGERRFEAGPLTWVAAKNKYFVVGFLRSDSGGPFSEFSAIGGVRTGKAAVQAKGTIITELKDGTFDFDMYVGPQEWRRLRTVGREFDTVNPYGGWFQGIVQPFATMVMRVLLWMRDSTKLSYGWVLVIFGISVRLLLWPLNQSAMRSSLKMQRVQPELQEAQRRFKADPARQQQEILKIYREHDMSPFSSFMGCLPMLIPMPVLLALFYVFQNTIEFRGVPFLWLPDISLKDPFYVLPLLTGTTMLALSWIGMRNAPPNPQAKMMGYMLPAMMTYFFLNFASGLNLYYVVQNIVTIPQQWLIAKQRGQVASRETSIAQKATSPPARAS